MELMKHIFEKYDEGIIRAQDVVYEPVTERNFNV